MVEVWRRGRRRDATVGSRERARARARRGRLAARGGFLSFRLGVGLGLVWPRSPRLVWRHAAAAAARTLDPLFSLGLLDTLAALATGLAPGHGGAFAGGRWRRFRSGACLFFFSLC